MNTSLSQSGFEKLKELIALFNFMSRSSGFQARLDSVKSKAMEIVMIASEKSLEFLQHV